MFVQCYSIYKLTNIYWIFGVMLNNLFIYWSGVGGHAHKWGWDMWKLWVVSNVQGKIYFQQNNDHSSNDSHSVSRYRASNPSNLQPTTTTATTSSFLAAVPCESRESETKAKLVIIVTSCPESTPIAFAYATTVEVVVVEEKIPHILIDFWITTKGGERKLFKWILSNHQSKAILLS